MKALEPNNTLYSSQGAINATKVATTKNNQSVASSESSSWVYEPITGNWKLSIVDINGKIFNMTNGFLRLNQNLTNYVNNIQTGVSDTYYFDSNGNMVKGWVQTSDN